MKNPAYLVAFIDPETGQVRSVSIFSEHPVNDLGSQNVQAILYQSNLQLVHHYDEAVKNVLERIQSRGNLRRLCEPWWKELRELHPDFSAERKVQIRTGTLRINDPNGEFPLNPEDIQ
jgi:hypothetical protein